jgi:hypothetical protein
MRTPLTLLLVALATSAQAAPIQQGLTVTGFNCRRCGSRHGGDDLLAVHPRG